MGDDSLYRAGAEPEQRTGLDLLEGYFTWRPAAKGSWSWSLKTGAFFHTISLENDDLGWTSPYTLTPSAINSWIGEELRTIGSEEIVRHDTDGFRSVSCTAIIFFLQRSGRHADRQSRLDNGWLAFLLLQRCTLARCHNDAVSPGP